ncbi:MAG TPA: OB-fold domain-containing protein [Candidatus Binatia bacterium]|nr:OB-fold domain-containing protein [Candidatus Binatia bacterium]
MAEARAPAERHLPDVDWPPARPFWEACRAGELRIPRCADCGRWVWYPSAACPGCGGGRHRWTHVSGRGRVFTWVTVHRAFLPGYEARVPYVTALVELEEDPRVRLATFLRDVPPGGPSLGLPVEAVFERIDERVTLPAFRCVAGR